MRVLHVVQTLEIGGAERVITDLVTHMPNHVESYVCCLKTTGPMASRLPKGVKVFELNGPEGNSIRLPFQLARIIRLHGIDIVHGHNWNTFVESGIAAILAGNKPVLHTIHGMYMDYDDTVLSGIKKFIRRGGERLLVRRCCKICAVSSLVERYTVPHLNVNPKKTCTIINGIQVEKKPKNYEINKKEFGFQVSDVVLCFVGRVAKVKNLKFLLSVIPDLMKKIPGVRLLIVGDGDERLALEQYAQKLGLEENVFFCGFQQEPMKYLSISDIFVLPSLYEGVSIALLESMATGMPAVVTDVGGNKEVVDDSVTGFIVPLNSKKELFQRLVLLSENSELRESFAKKARERAKHHFSIQRTVKKYVDIYSKCLSGEFV